MNFWRYESKIGHKCLYAGGIMRSGSQDLSPTEAGGKEEKAENELWRTNQGTRWGEGQGVQENTIGAPGTFTIRIGHEAEAYA